MLLAFALLLALACAWFAFLVFIDPVDPPGRRRSPWLAAFFSRIDPTMPSWRRRTLRLAALAVLLAGSALAVGSAGCANFDWASFSSKLLAQGGACAIKVASDEGATAANGLLASIDGAIAKGVSPTNWAALGTTAAIEDVTCLGADLYDDLVSAKTSGPGSPPRCKRGGKHRPPGPEHEAYLRALLHAK